MVRGMTKLIMTKEQERHREIGCCCNTRELPGVSSFPLIQKTWRLPMMKIWERPSTAVLRLQESRHDEQ